MEQEQELPESEKFSDDPEENLRLENEFLKMKIMAESGGIFGGDDGTGLPPEIENQWLKNVMEFEKAYVNVKPQKIAELLGNPSFESEENLDDKKFKSEFLRLQKLLKNHNINVDFIASQNDRVKYNFITGELFEHETDFVPVKGIVTNFIYEEFHPDHKQEITDVTHDFLNDYFKKKLDIGTSYIGDDFVEPDGNIMSKEQLMKNIQAAYDVFVRFENNSFTLYNVEFELKEVENAHSGMGFSEGEINYDIIFQGGERKKIRGPFKIYFIRQWEAWNIYFFYLAGLNYHPKSDQ